MFATNFLCSVYLACFAYIDPFVMGEGVNISGEFEWLEKSVEVNGENYYSDIYGGSRWEKRRK